MKAVSSLTQLNPFKILPSRLPFSRSGDYAQLPSSARHTANGSIDHGKPQAPKGFANGYGLANGFLKKKTGRFLQSTAIPQPLRTRRSVLRIIGTTVVVAILITVLAVWDPRHIDSEDEIHRKEAKGKSKNDGPEFFWQVFPKLSGFYNGVATLVTHDAFTPEPLQNDSYIEPLYSHSLISAPPSTLDQLSQPLNKRAEVNDEASILVPLNPLVVSPYPDYTSPEYLDQHYSVQDCFVDHNETIAAPNVMAYPGIPQYSSMPYFGAYNEINVTNNVCWERFGRLGPYGYGYGSEEGGLGIGSKSERHGTSKIWEVQPKVNWHNIDWGTAQKNCYNKNAERFTDRVHGIKQDFHNATTVPGVRRKLPRTAFVLRAWTGFEFTPHEILYLRSMISELSIKSGGEYDVHILMQVRDEKIPIWADDGVYQEVIQDHVPKEFRNITTLWNIPLIRSYYPSPFPDPFENPSKGDIHGVYRSAHFPLQWFAQKFPEYDFVWNWEMDIRYSGHHYEFHQGVAEFAKRQPRKGLWERNAKFWIPSYHGDWANFTQFVHNETLERGEVPVWGPVSFPNSGALAPPPETKPPRSFFEDNFDWGVGEEADLITMNPIFDPSKTSWVFRHDITGYNTDMPIPPRRCAIVTVSRLSRRLLDIMHKETWQYRHSAFPEMWTPTVALHHGLKAVYAPHPVFFDRKWPLEYLDKTFNYPKNEDSSVFTPNIAFGWGEHNWLGSSFYYNSGFSGALWRRWLGQKEADEGGASWERKHSGRMCLRSVLHHPIKNEDLPVD